MAKWEDILDVVTSYFAQTAKRKQIIEINENLCRYFIAIVTDQYSHR
jgi:hypothetical protein